MALPPHDLSSTASAMPISATTACTRRCRFCRGQRNRSSIIRRLVLETGRADNVEHLRGLPDVVMPRMAMMPKRKLIDHGAAAEIAARGFAFPLLVRAIGFHTGYHFAEVATPQELSAAVNGFPGDDVCVIERLDARDGEGMYRKYRVMFVDGTLYPLHLAISRDWKVHYFTADMSEFGGEPYQGRNISRRHGRCDRAARHRRARAHPRRARARLRRHRLRRECAWARFCSSKPMPPWSFIRRSRIRNGPIAARPSKRCSPQCGPCLFIAPVSRNATDA